MKKLFLILFLLIFCSISKAQSTESPFSTEGWDPPAELTEFYQLYIYQILSNPGGYININTRRIDSLFSRLVVYVDEDELIIENDTLRFSPVFITTLLDLLAESDSMKYRTYIPSSPDSVSYKEGRIFYDSSSHALVVYNDENEVIQQIGREFFIRVYNNTGSTITNGNLVYVSEEPTLNCCPLVALAEIDSVHKLNVLGFATHDIENSSYGYITIAGVVNDVNTSLLNPGDKVYLDTLAGQFTGNLLSSPYTNLQVGYVIKADVSGSILVKISPVYYNEVIYANSVIINEKDHGFYAFEDSLETITIASASTWYQVTNTTGNLFSAIQDNEGFVYMPGDTIQFTSVYNYIGSLPHVKFSFSLTGIGIGGNVYEVRLYNVTQDSPVTGKGADTGEGAGDYISIKNVCYQLDVNTNDKYVMQIRNITAGNDFDVVSGNIFCEVSHY